MIVDLQRALPKKTGGWKGSGVLPLILLSELDDGVLVMGISPLLPSATNLQDPAELV